jgi:hypothetical protein
MDMGYKACSEKHVTFQIDRELNMASSYEQFMERNNFLADGIQWLGVATKVGIFKVPEKGYLKGLLPESQVTWMIHSASLFLPTLSKRLINEQC